MRHLPAQPLAWAAFVTRVRRNLRDAHALTAYQFATQARPKHRPPAPHTDPPPTATGTPHPEQGTICPAMTADRSDLYAVLGLTSGATQEQIRRAYRALMRQNHPDTRPFGEPPGSAASDAKLHQATSAYSVLGDPARRALYDHRATPTKPAPPIRVRTVLRVRPATADQPPILVGPVRWHPSR